MADPQNAVAPEANTTLPVDQPVGYDDEEIVWKGSPSQIVNLGTFIFWGIVLSSGAIGLLIWNAGISENYSPQINQIVQYAIAAIMILGVLNSFIAYLSVRSEQTVITRNKIKEAKGITSIFRRELFCEISDITDFKSPPAGLLGLFGLSTLVIETHDDDQPIIRIRAIRDRDGLIKLVLPVWRKAKMDRKGYFSE